MKTRLKDVVDAVVIDDKGEVAAASLKRLEIKNSLLAAAAACDRGFAAFPNSAERNEIDSLVAELSQLTPISDPTSGLPGSSSEGGGSCPLEGNWRLVYTTAYDVLSLGASPLTSLEGIYQDFSPEGPSVNVIDLCPRLQVAFPLPLSSTLRLKVKTRARARSPTRVGLTFEAFDAGPIRLLGQDTAFLPRLGGNLPTFTGVSAVFGSGSIGAGEDAEVDALSYFDVVYLDEQMLIIQQNAPGGIFVSVKTPERML